MVHHFITASLVKSLQGSQMWFVLMIMAFVMMMMNYSGDGDPSLCVHYDDQGDGDDGKTLPLFRLNSVQDNEVLVDDDNNFV